MLALAGPVPLSLHTPPVTVAVPRPNMSDRGDTRTDAQSKRSGPDMDGMRSAPDPRLPVTGQKLSVSDSAAPSALFPPDPYALTGPTPAFAANVLDAERDLKAVLARLELARAQAEQKRIGDAGSPPSCPQRQTAADMGSNQQDRVAAVTRDEDAAAPIRPKSTDGAGR